MAKKWMAWFRLVQSKPRSQEWMDAMRKRGHPCSNLVNKNNTMQICHIGHSVPFSNSNITYLPVVRWLKNKKYKRFAMWKGAKEPGRYSIQCNRLIPKTKAVSAEKLRGGQVHQVKEIANIELTEQDFEVWEQIKRRRERTITSKYVPARSKGKPSVQVSGTGEGKSVRVVFENDLFEWVEQLFN